ncbi:cytochrome-c peroxidase [Roseateles sp. PN1]|uniref:cytochrome-c peroxidase n=1 Tax=Roseateles sp. PN1 TaxID=3137372 RepID=UPI0031392EA6
MLSTLMRHRCALFFALGLSALSAQADIGPMPMPLKGVPLPAVPGLSDGAKPIIVDRQKALILGKALFWDSNVGSDGMACASCHFSAGADRRVRNQLAPGGKSQLAPSFDIGPDGLQRGPNQTLKQSDFPFTQPYQPLADVDERLLARISPTVTGSAGSFGGGLKAVDAALGSNDDCKRSPDPSFHVAGIGARRVSDRNAPSVINAVFNHRLLWDGRASNVFNGSSAGGERDAAAGVWVQQADGTVKREKLALVNSALASQAMTAPLNDKEMSCQGRSLADIGRKLLYRSALETQQVHPQDSVLGPWSAAGRGQAGLTQDYIALVQQAFHPRFWSSKQRGPFGKPNVSTRGPMSQPYSQVEANFGLFFGLALQVYQSTLVSDDSPFDRSARDTNGLPLELSPAQARGLQVFRRAHCALCHIGPNFTSAAVDTNAALVASKPWGFSGPGFRNTTSSNIVSRMAGKKGFGFVDTGFAATGVGRDEWDIGLAGKDDWGNELAYATQYLKLLTGDSSAVKDSRVLSVRACDLPTSIALNRPQPHPSVFTQAQGVQPQPHSTQSCINPSGAFVPTAAAAQAELAAGVNNKRMLLVTDAAFKIPTLRNVELTGPYMHNGSMATLEQVIEFYARGGNFAGTSKQFGTIFGQSELQLDAQARSDLLEFLKSLTDERVRYERAPFDHPELRLLNGHAGDRTRLVTPGTFGAQFGQDSWTVIPAVGAQGSGRPLPTFIESLSP